MDMTDILGQNAPVQFPNLSEQNRPGIYFLIRDGVVVYVGQAVDMRRRVADHLGEGFKRFDSVSFRPCSVENLTAHEQRYIRKLNPEYNQCSFSQRVRRENEADNREMKLVSRRMPRSKKRRMVLVPA